MKESSYLILPKNHHIIPIFGLEPESLKKSAKEAIKNSKEDIRHTTILNALAKFFGANGGFQGYEKQYEKIQSFQKSYGMSHYEDLVTRRATIGRNLKSQRISERLFCSGKPLPKALFTGFNFDWLRYDDLQYEDRMNHLGKIGYWDYDCCFNLLGDSLISPLQGDGYIPNLYFPLSYEGPKEKETQQYQQAFHDFRTIFMESSELGWVDIIPFNDNLVFLKAPNGAFDFLFCNQRDNLPPRKFKQLDPLDIPRELDTQGNFTLVDYFRLGSWSEMEEHESEKLFYTSGGEAKTYPGSEEIKETYLKTIVKLPMVNSSRCAKIHPGFFKTQLENKSLYVSNLVSIQEFLEFLDDSDYESRRSNEWDNLKAVNLDSGNLPACINWYDANAYIAWFERKFDIPVRLLRIQEYLHIYPQPQEEHMSNKLPNDNISNKSLESKIIEFSKNGHHPDFKPNDKEVEFYYPDGREFDGKLLKPEDFQKIHVRWGTNLEWKQSKHGLNFLISWRFGEWLYENHETTAASVNTKTLKAAYEGGPLERFFFDARSCGKYKYRKIGFRLCYLNAD